MRGTGDRVAVAFSWRAPDGSRAHWAHVLTLSGNKIIAMQDHANPASAFRAVGA